MQDPRHLSSSLENYLETIYHLEAENKVARVRDIALKLEVKSSSVTHALRTLSARELVNYSPYSVITLTAEGRRLAEEVVKRHQVLKDFLISVLNINTDEAETTACSLEHSISSTVASRLTEYLEYMSNCPRGEIKWMDSTGFFCDSKSVSCAECVKCP